MKPVNVEKAFRSFLRTKSLTLASLTLPQAFDAMTEFWGRHKDFDVLAQDGDGIACYEDISNHGRGTRLEIGIVRLLRVASDRDLPPWPAHRLRLRLCYKWDADVVQHVLPAGTWAFACWETERFDAFRQSVFETRGFCTMRDKKPAEVNVSFDTISSQSHVLTPEVQARQMWWGVS